MCRDRYLTILVKRVMQCIDGGATAPIHEKRATVVHMFPSSSSTKTVEFIMVSFMNDNVCYMVALLIGMLDQ
jgi:hypothetical protein